MRFTSLTLALAVLTMGGLAIAVAYLLPARIAGGSISTLFEELATRLPATRWREKVGRLLLQAGESRTADQVIGVVLFTGCLGFFAGLWMARWVGWPAAPILAFAGLYLPQAWLQQRAQSRLHAFHKLLPYANDLLILGLQAGLDFVASLRHYLHHSRAADDPVAEELERALREIELGVPRHEALQSMAERVGTPPARDFVNAVVQAERRGARLADALRLQSASLRTHRSMLVEKLASRAGVVMLLPLLPLFAATILTLFGGVLVRMFRGELL